MGCGMKRNISDLMDHIAPEKAILSGDCSLDVQRIREMTMDKIETKRKPIRRWGVRLLLAAAITAMLAMSVLAVEDIMTYDNWFRDFFSGKEVVADISVNQLALLESSITQINQSVTSNGYTVTLETAITDGYVAYFTFRVDAPEGVVLDKDRYIFREVPLDLFGEDIDNSEITIRAGGWRTLEDNDPSDNSVRLLLEISINDPAGMDAALTDMAEKTIVLNTFLSDAGPESPLETQAEGQWGFTFTLPDTDIVTQEIEMLTSPVRCTARRQSGQYNFNIAVRVTSFRLRALTATLVFEEPLTGFWEGIILDNVYVVLKDGSRVLARFSDGSYREGMCITNMEFDVPISFADVDYIEFPGGDKAYMP